MLSSYCTLHVERHRISVLQVKWMIFEGLVADTEIAVLLGRALEDVGFIAHVTNDHCFANTHLFYYITKRGKAASRKRTP